MAGVNGSVCCTRPHSLFQLQLTPRGLPLIPQCMAGQYYYVGERARTRLIYVDSPCYCRMYRTKNWVTHARVHSLASAMHREVSCAPRTAPVPERVASTCERVRWSSSREDGGTRHNAVRELHVRAAKHSGPRPSSQLVHMRRKHPAGVVGRAKLRAAQPNRRAAFTRVKSRGSSGPRGKGTGTACHKPRVFLGVSYRRSSTAIIRMFGVDAQLCLRTAVGRAPVF